MSFSLIDVHSHVIPTEYRDAIAEAGGDEASTFLAAIPEWSIESHISFMKSANIKKSYLSCPPSCVLSLDRPALSSSASQHETDILCRRINRYMSQLCQSHPSQLGFFASLPLPSIDLTSSEIDFCATSLAADGFLLPSDGQDFAINSPSLAPIYSRLNTLHAKVLLHPTASCATHRQQYNISDGDRYPDSTLAFLHASISALRDLLLADVPSRYPHIRWIVPHSGAVLAAVLERLCEGTLTRARIKEVLAASFYFDLAGLPVNSQIHHVLRWTDHTRILYGSNVPFTDWRVAINVSVEVREELLKIFGVETGVHEAMCICYGNAELLFDDAMN